MRPCIERDCPELTLGTRCVLHEREHRRNGPGQRSSSRGWRRVRALALSRDRWRCVRCGASELLEVDHIDGNHRNDALWNLQTLCRGCHHDKHHQAKKGRASA